VGGPPVVDHEHLPGHERGGIAGQEGQRTVICRFGFDDAAQKVQELFLSGQKAAAAAAISEQLVHGVSLIGPAGHVRDRVAAFAEAGVTTLNAHSLATAHDRRVADIATLKQLAS
jgi:hypothetical protein